MRSAGDDPSIADLSPGSLTLVVPLFNEAHRFQTYAPQLVTFISQYPQGSEILFVDDGSSDGTVQMAEEFAATNCGVPIRLLFESHQGQGVCCRRWTHVGQHGGGVLLRFGSLDPARRSGPHCGQRSERPDIGDRITWRGNGGIVRHQRWSREMLGRTYNKAIQFSLVPGVVDTQCGAKAALTSVWASIIPQCREMGFAWDVEVIAVARAMGFQVREIGVEWRHQEGSRVKPLRDGAQNAPRHTTHSTQSP